jgi:hypothetical protein
VVASTLQTDFFTEGVNPKNQQNYPDLGQNVLPTMRLVVSTLANQV